MHHNSVIRFSQPSTHLSVTNLDLLNNISGGFDASSTLRTCYVTVAGFDHSWLLSSSCLKSETAQECHSLKRKQRGSTEEVLPQSSALTPTRSTLPHCQTGACAQHKQTHWFTLADTRSAAAGHAGKHQKHRGGRRTGFSHI